MVFAAVVDHQTHQDLSLAGRSRGNHVSGIEGQGGGSGIGAGLGPVELRWW